MEEGESERSGAWRPIPRLPISGGPLGEASFVMGSSLNARGLGAALLIYGAQPPSRYGALVKREDGDSKEEVPGSNPCGR
eukprot:756638-Pelagomonas_calceolata.AAC.1